jgi:DNA-binding PadR family transcriptional regulator
MATLYAEGDHYSITKIDIQLLIALLLKPMNGYELARQCEVDRKDSNRTMNIGAVQYSLKGMLTLMLIKEQPGRQNGPGKPSRIYKITAIGRQILTWEVSVMKNQLSLIDERI